MNILIQPPKIMKKNLVFLSTQAVPNKVTDKQQVNNDATYLHCCSRKAVRVFKASKAHACTHNAH